MTDPDRNPLYLVAELGLVLGDTHINQRPGLYHVKVDEHWELWLNPHREETSQEFEGRTVAVLPFSCYVEYNGWPAGVFNAAGGPFAAGECGNVETFMDALEVRIAAEKAKQ